MDRVLRTEMEWKRKRVYGESIQGREWKKGVESRE